MSNESEHKIKTQRDRERERQTDREREREREREHTRDGKMFNTKHGKVVWEICGIQIIWCKQDRGGIVMDNGWVEAKGIYSDIMAIANGKLSATNSHDTVDKVIQFNTGCGGEVKGGVRTVGDGE